MSNTTAPTDEEWQKRFPVLEIWMRKQDCKISLANDNAHLEVTLPHHLMIALIVQWQSLQDGTATEEMVIGRWYTGEWEKQTTAPTERRG